MIERRSIFIHGLGIALRRIPAFLWTYVFSLVLALGFCLPLKVQLSNLLDQSLASQRLFSGFDIGTAVSAAFHLHEGSASQAAALASHGAVPTYLLIYFLLVPGTLFCYITRTRAQLSTLLRQGLLHFWRFVRITILTLIAVFFILGPLMLLQARWASFTEERFVGLTALLLKLAGLFVVLLVASLLRLYFDIVEAYTVQLGTEHRPDGRPDRRVRRTLGPAWHLLRHHLVRAWFIFLLLAALGSAAAFFSARTAMHMLAQPRVWPIFLMAQLGVMALLFTRFWQRGAETSLVQQNPILHRSSIPIVTKKPLPAHPAPSSVEHPRHVEMIYNPDPLTPLYPAPLSSDDPLTHLPLIEREPPATSDPIPDPEPAVPSLDEPDPGVFHHDPQKPQS